MRIAMDATAAVRQQAGVGRFARGLLSGLSSVDCRNDYVLITTGSARVTPAACDLPPRHRWLRLPISERVATIVWQRMRLRPAPADLVRGTDFFMTPDFALPPLGRVPAAVTVHDLSFLVHPECADTGLRRYLEHAVPRSVERAAVVFAVSHTTASALTTHLGVSPSRIAVVSNAVDLRFRPVTDEARPDTALTLRETFGIDPGYVLTVGTLEPRKNLVRLLEAYAALRRRWSRRAEGGQCPLLVIVGREGWRFEPIFRTVALLGVGNWVRFLTRVPDAALLTLYHGARAFVCASLYEGFGIPPLEALACGIPVTSSTGGALLEVMGDAALLFEPTDLDAMTNALERILTDEELRARLIPAGLKRSAGYSWEESARSALAAVEKAAA